MSFEDKIPLKSPRQGTCVGGCTCWHCLHTDSHCPRCSEFGQRKVDSENAARDTEIVNRRKELVGY